MKTYIGIDIGLQGAIVVNKNGEFKKYPMPVIGNQINIHVLVALIEKYKEETSNDLLVVFEQLGLIFKSSKATAFSMGKQKGILEGILIALKVPFAEVRAVDWQKEMFAGVDPIYKSGKNTRDTKKMALVAVRRLFPDEKLTFAKKEHDGLIDALLMSEYAKRKSF